MRREPCRPFTVLDAMALVGATALGLALALTYANPRARELIAARLASPWRAAKRPGEIVIHVWTRVQLKQDTIFFDRYDSGLPFRPSPNRSLNILEHIRRVGWDDGPMGSGQLSSLTASSTALDSTIEWCVGSTSCLAAAWTLALVGLRLRRPRPALARLGRQPGFVAGCAAAAALVAGGAYCFPFGLGEAWTGSRFIGQFHLIWLGMTTGVASAVAGSWAILATSAHWRPEPGWIDRSGRALGGFWIGVLFLDWFYFLIGA